MVGNFRGVLIFVDFVGPTKTTKNSYIDPRKYNFLGLKTTNVYSYSCVHSHTATYLAIYSYVSIVSMITLNENFDLKYTRITAPTKINTHGNSKL